MEYQEALQVTSDLLPEVELTLCEAGFGIGPQIWKPGQRSGWIMPLKDGYQWHVRLFNNGVIQPEREVHWQYVEHSRTSTPNIEFIMPLLDEKSIPYQIICTEPYATVVNNATTRTPWIGVILMGMGIVAFMKALGGGTTHSIG